MNRTLGWFVSILAGLLALSVGTFQIFVRRSGSTSEFWLIDAGTLTAYLILAIAWSSASKGKLNLRSKVLVALACSTPVLIGLVQSFVATGKATDSPFMLLNPLLEVLYAAGFLGAMAFFVWIATRTRTGTPRLASCVAIVGCLLVLSSLFLPITFQSDSSQRAAGWRILDRQEHWITSYASVGQSAAFGDRIPWLQPVFQVAGFSFYGVTVLATIAMLITLIALRLSPARLAPMSVFRRLTAVLSLASVWVLEDIHWGWHFDFSGFVYAALAATAFWLTMIVSSAVVVWRIAVSDPSPALISWLRLIQIPMIAFNLMFMRAYFEHDSYIPFTGLAVLLFGLPMLSWACQEILLVNRAKVIVTDARSKQELEPVTSLL